MISRDPRELAEWNPQDFVETQQRHSWNISKDTSSLTYFAYFAMISFANIFSSISAIFPYESRLFAGFLLPVFVLAQCE